MITELVYTSWWLKKESRIYKLELWDIKNHVIMDHKQVTWNLNVNLKKSIFRHFAFWFIISKHYLKFSSFNLRMISALIAATRLNFLISLKSVLSNKSSKSSRGFKLSLMILSFSSSSLLSFLLLSLILLKSLRNFKAQSFEVVFWFIQSFLLISVWWEVPHLALNYRYHIITL